MLCTCSSAAEVIPTAVPTSQASSSSQSFPSACGGTSPTAFPWGTEPPVRTGARRNGVLRMNPLTQSHAYTRTLVPGLPCRWPPPSLSCRLPRGRLLLAPSRSGGGTCSVELGGEGADSPASPAGGSSWERGREGGREGGREDMGISVR